MKQIQLLTHRIRLCRAVHKVDRHELRILMTPKHLMELAREIAEASSAFEANSVMQTKSFGGVDVVFAEVDEPLLVIHFNQPVPYH